MREEIVEIAESKRKVYSNKLTDTGFVIGLLALTAIGIFITSMSWQEEMWLLVIIGVLVTIFFLLFFIPFSRRLFSTKPLFVMSLMVFMYICDKGTVLLLHSCFLLPE